MTLGPEPRPCLRAYMNALHQQRELDHFLEVAGICEGIKEEKEEVGLRVRFLLPSDPTYEVPFGRGRLGEGAFGLVLHGFAIHLPGGISSPLPVAIKTFRVDSSDVDVTAFVQEIEMMKFIGKHENMIRLQATSIHNVANGMVYLVSKDIVHRDLAARNVVLTKGLVRKVADFGLTRKVEFYYRLKGNGRAPLKWMAPESIFQKVFTAKPDMCTLSTASRDVASTTVAATTLDRWLLCVHASSSYPSYPFSHQLSLVPYPLSNHSSRPFKFYLIQSYPSSFAQLLVSLPKVIRKLKFSELGCCNFYLCEANILHKGDDRCKTVALTVVTFQHPAQHKSRC
uniref:Protein kinase domain-containing protein n=1 Tax=Echinococcus canadensis TaxID=519352 RepID=A0A915EVT6_9CEST